MESSLAHGPLQRPLAGFYSRKRAYSTLHMSINFGELLLCQQHP